MMPAVDPKLFRSNANISLYTSHFRFYFSIKNAFDIILNVIFQLKKKKKKKKVLKTSTILKPNT